MVSFSRANLTFQIFNFPKNTEKMYIQSQHRILVASKSLLLLDNRFLCTSMWFFPLSDPCLIGFKQVYPAGKTFSGCNPTGWMSSRDAASCIFHACLSNTQAFLFWEDDPTFQNLGCNMRRCDPGAVISAQPCSVPNYVAICHGVYATSEFWPWTDL